jgi:hypothetical protein
VTDKVIPSHVVNAVTPLSYDGGDFYALRSDKQTDGNWALRVTTPVDRSPTTTVVAYGASLTTHTLTERASYSVPSGKRAYLQCIYLNTGLPTTTEAVNIRVTLNTHVLALLAVTSTTTVPSNHLTIPLGIWLTYGDIVKIYTLNSTALILYFKGDIFIVEFAA